MSRLTSGRVADPVGCLSDSSTTPVPQCPTPMHLSGKAADGGPHLEKEVSGVLDDVVAAMIQAWNAEGWLPEGIQNAGANDPDKSVRWVGSCIIRAGSAAGRTASPRLPSMPPLWLASLQPQAATT